MIRAKILYVDDTSSYRALAKMMLGMNLEQDVDFASNGIDALSKIKKKNYDLVITDYHMRRMNCDKMIKEMEINGTNIPVVIIGTELNGFRSERVIEMIDKRGVNNMEEMYRGILKRVFPNIELKEPL